MNRNKFLDYTTALAICFIMLSYAVSNIFIAQKQWAYPVCGVVGITIVGISVLRRGLWAFHDAILLCAFLCLSMVSCCLSGIDPISFLCSRFFAFWMICLAMYYVIQSLSDVKRYIGIFFFFAALMLCFISIYVIFHASASILKNVINEDTMKGCFSGGRLYGMGNANVLGTASAVHLLISMIGFIWAGKRNRATRIFFAVSAFIAWVTLGLTGCRSGRIAVAVATVLISYVFLKDKMPVKKGIVMLAFLTSVMIGLVSLLSFFLPGLIYKGAMYAVGNLWGLKLSEELEEIALHRIVDDDGTLTGRTEIWMTGIKACLKNIERFLFGISPLGAEKIHGYTAGHHEMKTSHSHNVYIEILRRHGILGFIPMIAVIIGWGVNGIKILFSKEKDIVSVGVVSLVVAVLLMGMTEPLPFISAYETFATLPFFIACGYCAKLGRQEQ